MTSTTPYPVRLRGRLDTESLRRALDDCLIPARAFTPSAWEHRPDPFPAWSPA